MNGEYDGGIILCPICETAVSGTPFLIYDNVPVLLNQPCLDIGASRRIPRGKLRFYACNKCGFLWNAAFDAVAIEYNDGYAGSARDCSKRR